MFLMTGLMFFMMAGSSAGEPVMCKAPEVDLRFGHGVANRNLVGSDSRFRPGDKAIAWTSIAGVDAGFVEHVWYRNGEEIARHYLPVGAGRRWRTWSRHQLRVGEYTVEVRAPDGRLLARGQLSVEAPGDSDVDAGC